MLNKITKIPLHALLLLGVCAVATMANAGLESDVTTQKQTNPPSTLQVHINTVCDPRYVGIDAVYWTTTNSLPSSVTARPWPEIESYINDTLEKLVTENTKAHDGSSGIPIIKTAESAANILSLHPKSIYLNVKAWVPKTQTVTFAGYLTKDLILTVVAARKQPEAGRTQKSPLSTYVAQVQVFPFEDSHIPATIRQHHDVTAYLFSGYKVLLTKTGCDILENTRGKICTSRDDPDKNKVFESLVACK